MKRDPHSLDRSHSGWVTIRRVSGFTGGANERDVPPNCKLALYSWRPKKPVAADLPAGFTLAMRCLMPDRGSRRFVPDIPVEDFLLRASLGGHAILRAK
ncbi:MAG: hypothetical protein JWN86_586 [Planctomycetota bacterium]|nr:hypothetical protein [Planctomycetota bacterium]